MITSFSNQTRIDIEENIINLFNSFLYLSLGYLEKNFYNYRRVAFVNMTEPTAPFKLDYEECVNFMLDSKKETENIRFVLKGHSPYTWMDNDIRYPFYLRMPEPRWGAPDFWDYKKSADNLQYSCEAEFWEVMKNLDGYQKYSAINIFNEREFEYDKLSYYKNQSKNFYSKNTWFAYVASLVSTSFPEFKYNEEFSTKKVKRYLKSIGGNMLFGFEYEESFIGRELTQGTPTLPDFLNMILVAPSFNKNEPLQNYYYKSHSNILSLGILGNPFFYPPCYPLLGFSAVDSDRKSKNGNPYLTDIIKLEEDKYQLIHSKEYGESIKMHAYFYMDLLVSTSKPYLDYIENCVVNSLVK